ncbi:MAG: DNA/RNA nuclease SfsA [Alphaproteobacteria bacterium]
MRFTDPLIRATLVRRYKRFLADACLEDGTPITAHCPNPGSMMGLQEPGSEIWLSPARSPTRALRYTLELVRVPGGLVGINTAHPNRIAEEAIRAGSIPELGGYGSMRREVRYGRNSRIDLLLEADGRPPCLVEVKNVHLKRGEDPRGIAEFPDSVTARGAKHLAELADAVEAGQRAVMLYIVQRADCDRFRLAEDIDPTYARAFESALARGVEALCYACTITHRSIDVDRRLPIETGARQPA